MTHIPVLKDETIDGLALASGDIIIDGTLGGGGHTFEIIRRMGSGVKIIALDFDHDAIARTKEKIGALDADIVFRTIGFQDFDRVLDELNLVTIDKILLDLGLSSYQLDSSGRGFSFMRDEPLLMTMKKDPTDTDVTAQDIVNTWGEKSIADIIYGFGEEKYARRIARAIVEARKEKDFETTFDLVKVIDAAVGKSYRGMRIHPATRTFQALRIAVNGELQNLTLAIQKGFQRLSHNGRIAIITFHSLEDRIVKQAYVALKNEGHARIITKKPIVPREEEIINNSRARSAKLRILEKI